MMEPINESAKAAAAAESLALLQLHGKEAVDVNALMLLYDFLLDMMKAIHDRLDVVEAKPSLQDAGVWSESKTYNVGDLVSHGGSGWVCRLNYCHSKPGDDSGAGWRLLVKRGRDGRDLR